MHNVSTTTGNVRTRRNVKTKALPRPRSGLSQLLIGLVGATFIIVGILTAQTNQGYLEIFVISTGLLLPLFFLVEVGFRILYAIEECNHLITRYNNSILILLKDIFNFSSISAILAIGSIFVLITCMKFDHWPHKLWYDLGPWSVLFSLLGALFLQRVINLRCGPLYDSLWIENSNGLDYGAGMAYSFFYGYLHLIIPKTGNSEKNLEELMKDYEDKHHVQLKFYKLFILIPKSLYCFTSLMDTESSPSIEESSSLDSIVRTVAGVQNRVYKNSVYKINGPDDRKIYVAAEYATPLKTFKEVVSYNGEHSNHYMKHKDDVVLQFYLTLKKVLKEHENCTNYCELIFYDDKDENGRYKDVGKILLQRIKKLEQRQPQ